MIPNTERRLATVELVTSLSPIDGADAIERARIRGWDVVVKKGELAPGDRVVYMEIDTFLPIADERFAFLAPRGVRVQDGVEGHVLKTARLKGTYSQGIAFPYALFPEVAGYTSGEDVTDLIAGLTKWDPPLPEELADTAIGFFPSAFSKTGEERIQNLGDILTAGGEWVATEKLDGTSMSVIVLDGEHHVTGRTIDFADAPDHVMWNAARAAGLFEKIAATYAGQNVAVQGELVGPGKAIGRNPLKLREPRFAIFTIQVNGASVPRGNWPQWALDLSVPVHDLPFPTTLEEALAQVDSRPTLLPGAQGNIEGLVWRRADGERMEHGGRASFKVISPRHAMKHDA